MGGNALSGTGPDRWTPKAPSRAKRPTPLRMIGGQTDSHSSPSQPCPLPSQVPILPNPPVLPQLSLPIGRSWIRVIDVVYFAIPLAGRDRNGLDWKAKGEMLAAEWVQTVLLPVVVVVKVAMGCECGSSSETIAIQHASSLCKTLRAHHSPSSHIFMTLT